MDIFDLLLLSIVQGLTEFLPVSSSAHLILISEFLDSNDSGGYDYRATLTNWLKKLSTTMHASDNLTERDLAQLRSDVQQSYTVFTEELS